MEQELISVIVPVYNVERYLERCVNSLIKQSYHNLEIVLVDDGSTDGSGTLCDKIKESDQRITVIHKSNGGLSSARNAGLRIAKGRYIAFVDSDDWVCLDTYEYMYKLLKDNDADIADIRCIQVFEFKEDVKQQNEEIKVLSGQDILVHYMYRGMNEKKGAPYSSCRKLYCRELFSVENPFDETTINEDICFNFNILAKCSKVVVSNQVKYFYYQNTESITSSSLQKKDLALLSVSEDLVELAKGVNNKKVIELAEMKLARSYFSILARVMKFGVGDSIEHSEQLINDMVKKLRSNIFLLWKSPMPLNRKVIATLFCVNFKMCMRLTSRKNNS